jgi:hypothetical protein
MFKNNLFGAIITIILLVGNIYFFSQYVSVNKQLQQIKDQSSGTVSIRSQASLALKEYLNIVLNIAGTTSSDDRIKLESDLRSLNDPVITQAWTDFLASKDSKTSQANAVKLIGLLENKMLG